MVVVRSVQNALLIVPMDLPLVLVPLVALLLIALRLSLRLLLVPVVARLAIPFSLLVFPLSLRLLPVPLIALLLRLSLLVCPIRGVIRPHAGHNRRQHPQANQGSADPPAGCFHGPHSNQVHFALTVARGQLLSNNRAHLSGH